MWLSLKFLLICCSLHGIHAQYYRSRSSYFGSIVAKIGQVKNLLRKDSAGNFISPIMKQMLVECDKEMEERQASERIMATKFTERNHNAFDMVRMVLKAPNVAKDISNARDFIEILIKLIVEKYKLPRSMLIRLTKNSSWLPKMDPIKPDEPIKPIHGKCPFPSVQCKWLTNGDKFRTIDGSCNNKQNPLWGRELVPLRRFLPPDYSDSYSKPRGPKSGNGELPNARKVSSTICVGTSVPDTVLTTMIMTWGQFLDHDIALAALSTLKKDGKSMPLKCGNDGCDDTIHECLPIWIPRNDPFFKRKKCLEFVRSEGVTDLQCCAGPRQQLNRPTSWIDASMVYGNCKEDSDHLREFKTINYRKVLGAKLKTSPSANGDKPLMPKEDNSECVNTTPIKKCFLSGDERANEQHLLTTIHTIYVREHNRIVDELRQVNPQWNEERLFQEARKIVGATIQHITYNEFLPIFLGSESNLAKNNILLKKAGYFRGYNPKLDGTVSNIFGGAAFRVGHSLVPTKLLTPDRKRNIFLSDAFFRPTRMYQNGIVDSYITSMLHQDPETTDPIITPQVTQHLFTDNPPHGMGTDLASINIQRGRDHGLPGYNAWRKWCGLRPARDFDDLASRDIFNNAEIAKKFESCGYESVDDLDIFVAGLSEPAAYGGLVGATFNCILSREFKRRRVADRFWYERSGPEGFTTDQLTELRQVTLAKVLCNNGDYITRIQKEAMKTQDEYTNPPVDCSQIPDIDFNKWKEPVYSSYSYY